MPDVANLLKEESVKFRLKQLELEHRNSYNALRNAAEKGDLVQFTNILRKVSIITFRITRTVELAY